MEHVIEAGPDPRWLRAEAFRRAEVYGRAAATFAELWELNSDPSAGWRWAFCLRRQNRLEEALTAARAVLDEYPDHPQAHQEYLWCLNDQRLRPLLQDGAPGDILEAATALVEAGAEGVLLKRAVFAAIGAAKKQGRWERVAGWCDLLDPEELSSRSTGQRSFSDRERYYYAKLKATVQLGEFEQALRVAGDALRDFPKNPDFRRWQALSQAGLGDLDQAVAGLESLAKGGKWYVLAELARCYLLQGQFDKSWQTATRAARQPGEDSAKVGLFETLARIALALDDLEAARDHLGLCLALRQKHQWNVSQDLARLVDEVEVLCGSAWESHDTLSPADWRGRCAGRHWDSAPTRGEPVLGEVTGLEDGRNFAFIRCLEDSERVFVRLDDLPDGCAVNGAQVEFIKVKSYDQRRQRDSWRAARVRPART